METRRRSAPRSRLWALPSTNGSDSDFYLRELPLQLHPLGLGIAALDEPWPAVDVHQTPVVIVVNGGAEDAHMDLLAACVVHVLGVKEGRDRGQMSTA